MQQKKKSTIISEGSDKPAAPKSRHYVNNKDFYQALVEHRQKLEQARQQGEPDPKPSDYIGECIIKIAEGLQKKSNFNRPRYQPYINEMIGDAVINCIAYINNFDPSSSKNPFSYFTQTCYYSFLRTIEQEDLSLVKRYKATLNSATLGELSTSDDEGIDPNQNMDASIDNMEDFVRNYEKKIHNRKEKAKARKEQKKKKGLEDFMENEGDDGGDQ